jgi:hypothetical protein
MIALKTYLDIFDAVKAERAAGLQWQHKLVVKTGEGLSAAILKVLKPEWTTDPASQLLNTNGLFFSIWVDAACEAKGIARYNLHAKKLRALKGEAFKARDFARQVRSKAKAELAPWPHLIYPIGPITLFEGHVPLDLKTLHSETGKLIDRFVALSPLLDTLLEAA